MGSRYIITGVQLGILMSSLDEKQRIILLQEVMDNQLLEDMIEINVKDKKFGLLGENE